MGSINTPDPAPMFTSGTEREDRDRKVKLRQDVVRPGEGTRTYGILYRVEIGGKG